MPLFAHSQRTRPITLLAGAHYPSTVIVLEQSGQDGFPGPGADVTNELRGLSSGQQATLQTQVAAGDVTYRWSGVPEFSTGVVTPSTPSSIPIYANETARDASSPSEGQIAISGGKLVRFVNGAWGNYEGAAS
jgi:hypothetical protein